MNTNIVISPIEKLYQVKIGALLLLVWKTYRWRAVFYVGHHRYQIF